jgi:acyl-CoA synthetase (NDP forming)
VSANLVSFFRPRTVVVVGASERSGWSGVIANKFKDFAHPGRIYAVNRAGTSAHGWPGFASCRDLPDQPDIAFLCVNAAATHAALLDALDAGIRNVVVLTSGFGEVPGGEQMEAALVDAARARGATLLGPNSMGFANIACGLVTTAIATRQPVLKGRIGIVSQSGMVCSELIRHTHQQGVGLSFICATGNEAMLSSGDVIEYLVDDPNTAVIIAYAETIRDPAKLRRAAAHARAARKAIVMLKVGRSAMSAEVARAHTGAVVGDDRVFDAFCDRYAISRVDSIEEAVVTAALIERNGPLEKTGAALVSITGGGCAVFADLAEAVGLPVPQLAAETRAALKPVLPAFASTLNPLDVTGAVLQDFGVWEKTMPIVYNDPSIGIVLTLMSVPSFRYEVGATLGHWSAIAAGYRAAGKRAQVVSMATQPMTDDTRALMAESGVDSIVFGLEGAVRALGHLTRWSRKVAGNSVSELNEAQRGGPRPQGERAVLDFLSARGVPVIPATLVKSADEAAGAVGADPVVLKIVSPDIEHKTEVGGVHLNVVGADAARAAFTAMMTAVATKAPNARIDGAIVSPMRRGGVELFVGVARDPDWGPVLALGLGGVWIGALKDSVVRLLPLHRAEVREMIDALRGAVLLKGYRGAPPADLDVLANAVVAIGEAALALGPGLAALEVNPLLVEGTRVEALDGLAIWME